MKSQASLVVWGRESALNVQKVLWLVAELELDFTRKLVGGVHGGLSDPAFLAKNPHGRIPVLEDHDLVVWESHAILRYLAAEYGNNGFWPPSPARRSQIDGWMDWGQTTFQPDFMSLFWSYYRTPQPKRQPNVIRRAREALDAHCRTLNQQLGKHDFICGGTLSLADVAIGTAFYRYYELGLQVPRYAGLQAWYDRLCARAPYRRQVMIPFEKLHGRLAY